MNSRVIIQDEDKRELINRLSAQYAELALFCVDLTETPARAKEVREGVVIISAPYDFDELERSWYYGDWNLVSPANSDYKPVNTFKLSNSEIYHVMSSYGLSLIIDSFHDNIEWKVHENA